MKRSKLLHVVLVLVLVLTVWLPSALAGLQFLGNLFNIPGLSNSGDDAGRNRCDCPCREYWITQCSVQYIKGGCTEPPTPKPSYAQRPAYTPPKRPSYGSSPSYSAPPSPPAIPPPVDRECKESRILRPAKVKIRECQKCQKYLETHIEVSIVKDCFPEYDERCKTAYPQQCHTKKECTMVYQTQCKPHHYKQACKKVPAETCYNVRKCHRTPKTTCHHVKRNKCGKAPQPNPKQKPRFHCLPFGPKEPSVYSCSGYNIRKDDLIPAKIQGRRVPVSFRPPGKLLEFKARFLPPFMRPTVALGKVDITEFLPPGVADLGLDTNTLVEFQQGRPDPQVVQALIRNGALNDLPDETFNSLTGGQFTKEQLQMFQTLLKLQQSGAISPALVSALAGSAGSGSSGGAATGGLDPSTIQSLLSAAGSNSNGNSGSGGGGGGGIDPATIQALLAAMNSNGNSASTGSGGIDPATIQALLAAMNSNNNSGGSGGGSSISPAAIQALLAAMQGNTNNNNGQSGGYGTPPAPATSSSSSGSNQALLQALMNNPAALAALAGGRNNNPAGGSSSPSAAPAAPGGFSQSQLASLAQNPAVLSALMNNPSALSALTGGGSGNTVGSSSPAPPTGGLTPAQLTALQNNPAALAALTGSNGGSSPLANLTPAQLAALRMNPAVLSALGGGGGGSGTSGISASQLSALMNNPALLSALTQGASSSPSSSTSSGLSPAQLAALAGSVPRPAPPVNPLNPLASLTPAQIAALRANPQALAALTGNSIGSVPSTSYGQPQYGAPPPPPPAPAPGPTPPPSSSTTRGTGSATPASPSTPTLPPGVVLPPGISLEDFPPGVFDELPDDFSFDDIRGIPPDVLIAAYPGLASMFTPEQLAILTQTQLPNGGTSNEQRQEKAEVISDDDDEVKEYDDYSYEYDYSDDDDYYTLRRAGNNRGTRKRKRPNSPLARPKRHRKWPAGRKFAKLQAASSSVHKSKLAKNSTSAEAEGPRANTLERPIVESDFRPSLRITEGASLMKEMPRNQVVTSSRPDLVTVHDVEPIDIMTAPSVPGRKPQQQQVWTPRQVNHFPTTTVRSPPQTTTATAWSQSRNQSTSRAPRSTASEETLVLLKGDILDLPPPSTTTEAPARDPQSIDKARLGSTTKMHRRKKRRKKKRKRRRRKRLKASTTDQDDLGLHTVAAVDRLTPSQAEDSQDENVIQKTSSVGVKRRQSEDDAINTQEDTSPRVFLIWRN